MDIQGSEESMFFHNKAVAAIKARLESDDEADWIEDGVLGTVIGFVCHAVSSVAESRSAFSVD